jgi:DNA repair protein RadC
MHCAKCSNNFALKLIPRRPNPPTRATRSPSRIREMPQEERPREKLAAHGASALTDPELIAILLRTGIAGANAIEVARELLKRHGSLRELSRCGVDELAKVPGVGFTKAVQLAAAFDLGNRLARETLANQKIDSPELVNELVGGEMRMLRTEAMRVILLDTRYRLIRVEEISTGSVNESIAHPREIFRPALIASAYAVIVVHNHPSGDPSPSQADHNLTRRLAEAAELMQIKLLDHIIIGAHGANSSGYFSFKEAGVL